MSPKFDSSGYDEPIDELIEEEEEEPLTLTDTSSQIARDFARFTELTMKKRTLNAEIKGIERELAQMGPRLKQHFERIGQRAAKLLNGTTVYLKREYYIKPLQPGNKLAIAEALRDSGFNHFVHLDYHAGTVSKWVREKEREHAEEIAESNGTKSLRDFLPSAFAELVNLDPTWKVYARRGRSII